jgi:hypothetical protein
MKVKSLLSSLAYFLLCGTSSADDDLDDAILDAMEEFNGEWGRFINDIYEDVSV